MLLLCLGMAGIAGYWLNKAIDAGFPMDEKTGLIMINILFLDVGILFVTWMFLKENALSWKDAFGLCSENLMSIALMGALTAVAGFFMAAMVGALVANVLEAMNIEVSTQEVVNTFQNAEYPAQKLLLALMAVIFAPFVEELMFRGVLFTALKQYLPRWIAIWGSALFFGLVHVNVMSFIPLTLLAVLLTRLYEHTSNLWAPIFAHPIFNSINLGLMLWLPELIETQTP